MSDKPKTAGKPGDDRDSREERLAAALRENLRRRKAQDRGRRDEGAEGGDAGSGAAPADGASGAA